MIMGYTRSHQYRVLRSYVRLAAELQSFTAGPPHLLLVALVLDKLVLADVDHQVTSVGEAEAHCKEISVREVNEQTRRE